jgi:hypothetical protein
MRAFSDMTGPGGAGSGDPLNYAQQYGLNTSYHPERLVMSYSWDIPSGNLKGVAHALLGGWNLSGITTIQDGLPLSVYNTTGGGVFGLSGSPSVVESRAEMTPGETYADVATTGSVQARLGGASGGPGYFNTAAFVPIPIIGKINGVGGGTGWGNSGVGIILGPGQFNFDTALTKNTRVGGIHENATLHFRAEFFNLFNHPQFNNPSNDEAQSTFGQITSTSVNPRLVQLALKYIF